MRTPVWMRSTAISSLIQPWYKCTKVSVKHFGDDPVLLPPDLLHPPFEAVAHLAGVGDRGSKELGRDLDASHPHFDPRKAVGDESPHARVASGVDHAHVVHAVELLGHRRDDEADAADPRPEQVTVRRSLIFTLLFGESGPFDEIDDRHGNPAVTPAGDAGGLEIASAFLGMPGQVLRGVAAHERKLERPAGLADDREPDQDPFEKEADEWCFPDENPQDGEDVHPGNVIADDQVVAVA